MKQYGKYDIVIIGGGPAGLAAAVGAKENGADSILILERDRMFGGILNQCIHNGFGLHIFQEELTGPEYAARFITQVRELGITCKPDTMVMSISKDKQVLALNREEGMFQIQAKAVILAMGCRERPRGALNIPGYRPAGIYSAGTAQRLVNMEGLIPGKEAVILGSGDIGLIMARRLTLEGAKVKAVAELMPYSGGLKRNIVQCLVDYNIPLKLSHTVIDIDGKERVKGVTLARVDAERKIIKGTEEYISCDTLLLSVGLIPENELSDNLDLKMVPATLGPEVNESLETSMAGVFACGNVLHVHDLVDYVTREALLAGRHAAEYVKDEMKGREYSRLPIALCGAGGVRYTVPKYINPKKMEDTLTVRFRVDDVYQDRFISVYFDGSRIKHKKKRVLAPGEMEEVTLKKEALLSFGSLSEITIKIEEE